MRTIHPETESNRALAQSENQETKVRNLSKETDEVVDKPETPLNFIWQTVQEIAASPEIKANLVTLGVGLAATYVSRVWFKRISGQVIQRTVAIAVIIALTQLIKKGLSAIQSED